MVIIRNRCHYWKTMHIRNFYCSFEWWNRTYVKVSTIIMEKLVKHPWQKTQNKLTIVVIDAAASCALKGKSSITGDKKIASLQFYFKIIVLSITSSYFSDQRMGMHHKVPEAGVSGYFNPTGLQMVKLGSRLQTAALARSQKMLSCHVWARGRF